MAGVDDSKISGHSFHISAATMAANTGLNDSLVEMLGHWKSSAFSDYITTLWLSIVIVSAAPVTSPIHTDNC